eukprot:TRINITY_DN32315_c0_g1_i1.p1 TRINITY_DN32315_c0_g1~~TRINITY_DN32315_c0_g1_i1.p1  ORF type:complete len:808 (+),score=204.04 TRINITY_DN32315_c0_g1_i1:158-2581(+)
MVHEDLERICRRPVVAGRHSVQMLAPPTMHEVRPGDSLQARLDAAAAGDEVVLHEGVYEAAVTVKARNLHIRAADGAAVTIHATAELNAAAAVTFMLCNLCVFENIAVRNDVGVGVLITRAVPSLLQCVIVGVAGGVRITANHENPKMCPTIARCTIQKSARGCGIALEDAKAIVERNVITGNADAGILYSGQSNPWISGNTIRGGKGAGIAVQASASGVITENTIEANECAGVVVEASAQPVLWRNRVANGGAEGVRLEPHAKGLYDENVFVHNAACDMLIGNAADAFIYKTAFRGGSVALLCDGGSPIVAACTFRSYAAACITATGGGAPVLKGNVFSLSPHQHAVALGEHCAGEVDGNSFRRPRGGAAAAAAISCKHGCAARVYGNTTVFVEGGEERARPFDVVDGLASQDPEVVLWLGTYADHTMHGKAYAGIVGTHAATANADDPEPELRRRKSSFADRLLSLSSQGSASFRRRSADVLGALQHTASGSGGAAAASLIAPRSAATSRASTPETITAGIAVVAVDTPPDSPIARPEHSVGGAWTAARRGSVGGGGGSMAAAERAEGSGEEGAAGVAAGTASGGLRASDVRLLYEDLEKVAQGQKGGDAAEPTSGRQPSATLPPKVPAEVCSGDVVDLLAASGATSREDAPAARGRDGGAQANAKARAKRIDRAAREGAAVMQKVAQKQYRMAAPHHTTVRRASSGSRTRRKASTSSDAGRRRTSKTRSGSRGSDGHMATSQAPMDTRPTPSSGELRDELEFLRSLLTEEEERREIALLREWLGSTRIRYGLASRNHVAPSDIW